MMLQLGQVRPPGSRHLLPIMKVQLVLRRLPLAPWQPRRSEDTVRKHFPFWIIYHVNAASQHRSRGRGVILGSRRQWAVLLVFTVLWMCLDPRVGSAQDHIVPLAELHGELASA